MYRQEARIRKIVGMDFDYFQPLGEKADGMSRMTTAESLKFSSVQSSPQSVSDVAHGEAQAPYSRRDGTRRQGCLIKQPGSGL
jgi:hypothetical protein